MNQPKINQPSLSSAPPAKNHLIEPAAAVVEKPVQDDPVVAQPAPVPAETLDSFSKPKQEVAVLRMSKERIPSNWNIVPLEGDLIMATAISTGDVFEGTIQEFNAMLKAH